MRLALTLATVEVKIGQGVEIDAVEGAVTNFSVTPTFVSPAAIQKIRKINSMCYNISAKIRVDGWMIYLGDANLLFSLVFFEN
jgi:hypothetical protein